MSGSRRLVGWVVAAVAVPAALAAIGLTWVQTAAPPLAAPSIVSSAASPPTAESGESGRSGSSATVSAAAQVAALLRAAPLLFDGERADLRPTTAAAADRLAEVLVAAPEASVRLVGHTADLPGPPVRAVALSRERAEAVAARLVAGGVDPARITVDGAGDADPLATPETSRRVEVSVG